ncbi:MAG TPA: type II toxin-antitoxin system RelE/ParE family toxin [Actinomycetota bacterium]|nr:type II toxin-antitoxin system RelE/ParE family toxin [Actinomycetota bacterium]
MAEVRLSRRAVKDLDGLSVRDRKSVVAALERLAANPSDPSLDVKPLVGRRPWRRLRVRNFRVLFHLYDSQRTLLVARVIDRKELEQAVLSLPD